MENFIFCAVGYVDICKYVFDMWENRNIFRALSNIYDGESRLLAIIVFAKKLHHGS